MLPLIAALTLGQATTGDSIYRASQRKLDGMKSVSVSWLLSNGDHPAVHVYARPNKGNFHTYGQYGFRTDGKRTFYQERTGEIVFRPYQEGDLKRMTVLGFESFYDPDSKLKAFGDAVEAPYYERRCWKVNVGFTPESTAPLYIDAETLLPAGHWDQRYYVDPAPKMEPWYFAFTEPKPAKEACASMRKWLDQLTRGRAIEFGVDKGSTVSRSHIWAMRPNLYREVAWVGTDARQTVVADGKKVVRREEAGKITSRRQSGWPHPWFPGLEAFFEPKTVGKVSGKAEVVQTGDQEGYGFIVDYPGRGRYRMQILPHGEPYSYTPLSGPGRGATYFYERFENGTNFNHDPRMFVLDPPDPLTLPPRE